MLCGGVGAKLMQTRKNVHPFASTNNFQVAKASALVSRFLGNIFYEIDCDMLEEALVCTSFGLEVLHMFRICFFKTQGTTYVRGNPMYIASNGERH